MTICIRGSSLLHTEHADSYTAPNTYSVHAFSSQLYILAFYLPARTRLSVLALYCVHSQGMFCKMLTDEDTHCLRHAC